MDLLVDLPAGLSIIDIIGIQIEIEDVLGVRVDLVSRADLREHVRAGVVADLVPL